MKIIHVVASVDDKAAGPSISVPCLAEAQARQGLDVTLHTVATGASPPSFSVSHTRHPASMAHVPVMKRLCASRAMKAELTAKASETAVVHNHGLWLMPNIYPAAMTRRGTKVVVAPRGMLGSAALKFSTLKKKLFHRALQYRALTRTAMFHATSEAEVADIRAFGFTAPVAMVPNGVEVPLTLPTSRYDGPPTVLSLGRIHPKKGLDRLIHAFHLINRPDWRLLIIGPSEGGHDAELTALACALGLANVTIEPAVFGADKVAAYRAAEIFALPTQHENFAMTVAEALAVETPVISTVGAPWQDLEREGCGLWVDHGPEAMAAALKQLMALSSVERAAMGARGRDWMSRDFSWDTMAARLREAYAWIVEDGARERSAPHTIRFVEPNSHRYQNHKPHALKET
ncbi:MAG: glycosyltransferase [Pseudomonadota bacterium]